MKSGAKSGSPILLCTATGVEARACQNGIKAAGLSSRFEVLQSGMGLLNAEKALRKRLEDPQVPKPALVISTGFAGVWSSGVRRGTWVCAQSVELESMAINGTTNGATAGPADPCRIDLSPRNEVAALLPIRMITLKSPSSQPPADLSVLPGSQDAQKLACAVDLESHAWARVSQEFDLPCEVIRMISDTPEEPLPKGVTSISRALLTGGSVSDRVSHLFSGLTESVKRPAEMARFIHRSLDLPALLQSGWKDLASVIQPVN